MREYALPRNRSQKAVEGARKARQNPSVAEKVMWQILRDRKLQFKFRREHPVGPYRLDFYCAEAMLAVEMDGEQHDSAQDAIRDKYLADLGIYTHRIPNTRFFGVNGESCEDELKVIMDLCASRRNSAPH